MVKLMTPEHFMKDKRRLERKEVAQSMDKKEMDQYLKNLPDEAANSTTVPIWDNENTLPSKRLGKLLQQEKRAPEPAAPLAYHQNDVVEERKGAALGLVSDDSNGLDHIR